MAFLAEIIDFAQEIDVFIHDLLIILFEGFLVLLKHLAKVSYVLFKMLALVAILFVQVIVTLLILYLFKDILFMKTNYSSFQLFEIVNMEQNFVNVVFELLLIGLLLIQFFLEVFNFMGQTFLSHTQIINNKCKILVNSVEMLQFLAHFACLFIEFVNFFLTRSDISFKLFNFVIKHELELL